MITYSHPYTFCYCVMEWMATKGYKVNKKQTRTGVAYALGYTECTTVAEPAESYAVVLIRFCQNVAAKFKLPYKYDPKEHKGENDSAYKKMSEEEERDYFGSEKKFNFTKGMHFPHGPEADKGFDWGAKGPQPDDNYFGATYGKDFFSDGILEEILRRHGPDAARRAYNKKNGF